MENARGRREGKNVARECTELVVFSLVPRQYSRGRLERPSRELAEGVRPQTASSTVTRDGVVTLETRNRREAATGWARQLLKGKKALQVVGE